MAETIHKDPIKAMMSMRIDKLDEAGNFIESVEVEPREVTLTQEQLAAYQAQADAAASGC